MEPYVNTGRKDYLKELKRQRDLQAKMGKGDLGIPGATTSNTAPITNKDIAKTIPEKKVGQFQTKSKQTLLTQQKKGEVPKTKGDWKTVLRNQTKASNRDIAAGKLGTKLKNLIFNLKGRPRGK